MLQKSHDFEGDICQVCAMEKAWNKKPNKKTTLSLGEENQHRILISSDVGISITVFAFSYNLRRVSKSQPSTSFKIPAIVTLEYL